MNWVDFLIIAVLLYTIWQGVIRGWVAALVGIIIMAASWLVTILLLPYYGPGVESLPLEAAWARTIAFGVILIGFYVIFGLIANTFLGGKRPKAEAHHRRRRRRPPRHRRRDGHSGAPGGDAGLAGPDPRHQQFPPR